jgi:radical SAM protein with 4Fe4S-binding SPASM domain
MAKSNALENFCHITEGMALNIDTDGRVQPCVNWTGVSMFCLKKEDGSVMGKDEFLAQWNERKINESRGAMKRLPSKECANCKAYGTYCTGGCPLVKFELGPHWKEYQKPNQA